MNLVIYGYLLSNEGGVPIKSWFTGGIEIPDEKLPLAASGIAGIHSLFTEITGNPPENVTGKNLQTMIFSSGSLILSIFSTKQDAMAESLARKFLHKLVKKMQAHDLDPCVVTEEKINTSFKEILRELKENIQKLNKKSQQTRYLHQERK